MSRRSISLLVLISSSVLLLASRTTVARDPDLTAQNAKQVLDELMTIPVHRIPKSMLSNAQAIAIVPNVIKVGFVAGVRRGHGVVMTRDAEGEWGLPQFVTLTGGSLGFQAGVQGTDVVLVFRSRRSVDNLMRGKFTIGADAAAAAGPVGRNAAAATDAQLKAEILSYSRSRGLFAGVSLDGSALEIDQASNIAFYGAPSTRVPEHIPPAAADLQTYLNELSGIEVATASSVTSPTTTAAAPLEPNREPSRETSRVASSTSSSSSDSSSRLEAIQRALQFDASELHAKLSPEWQKYLAVPAPSRPASSADPRVYAAVHERFSKVNANPEYKELTSSSEFQTAMALLKEFSDELNAASRRFSLPAPPRE